VNCHTPYRRKVARSTTRSPFYALTSTRDRRSVDPTGAVQGAVGRAPQRSSVGNPLFSFQGAVERAPAGARTTGEVDR
jgi:hypothetical protein